MSASAVETQLSQKDADAIRACTAEIRSLIELLKKALPLLEDEDDAT
jgi:hypothetical protein